MTGTFAELLRRHRAAAGLSQEELAERAQLSANAVSTLERGVRRAPYRTTVVLLADALGLAGTERDEFAFAADRARSRSARADREKHATHNLPTQISSFVGRRTELGDVAALLEGRSLVTIVGPGGIGKTRLAIEAGAWLHARMRDGVWFVDLAPLSDGAFVVAKIASVVQVAVASQEDQLASLATGLKTRRMLLILDNCEHLLSEAAAAARVLAEACPELTILATSRERLGVAGEAVGRLPPLQLPARHLMTAAEGRTYAAIELFAERAAAAEHRFVFTDERVGAVTDICRRLDGIALAIELAAARLPALGLLTLRSRLNEHFNVLSGGNRDLPARQQTLMATIAWSYDLLDERERSLLRRLTAFSGGWTLEAAETVCPGPDLPRDAVLDALSSLVEKSLAFADVGGEHTRYSLLDSTHAFAAQKLDEAGEKASLARAHAEWMARFAERLDATHLRVAREEWMAEAEPELDNARAALEWALGPGGDAVAGARIAGGLRGLWRNAGLAVECVRWSELALERLDAERHPEVAARVWRALSGAVTGRRRVEAAERAIALFERLGDRTGAADAYANLSHGLRQIGRLREAEAAIQNALEVARESAAERSLRFVWLRADLGWVYRHQGRIAEARGELQAAAKLAESLGETQTVSDLFIWLAEVEFDAGNIDEAVRLSERTATDERSSTKAQIFSLTNLAAYRLALEQTDAAESNARLSLVLALGREPSAVAMSVLILGAIAALRGHPARAARLLGYVEAWCARDGYQLDPTEQKVREILAGALHGVLSDDSLAGLAADGARLNEETALAEAREP